jgi:hypothetical protein
MSDLVGREVVEFCPSAGVRVFESHMDVHWLFPSG